MPDSALGTGGRQKKRRRYRRCTLAAKRRSFMRKLTLFAAAALAAVSAPALATAPIDPPTLHGFCSLGNICTDNGTNTPTVGATRLHFGLRRQRPVCEQARSWIDILVPNNLAVPASFHDFGRSDGHGDACSAQTAWTTGQLRCLSWLAQPAQQTRSAPTCRGPKAYQPSATGFLMSSRRTSASHDAAWHQR